MDDKLKSIVEWSEAKRLATGYVFTEGPVWHPDGYLIYTDIPNNVIMRLAPDCAPELIRSNTGAANGLALDLQRRILACEGSIHRLTCTEPDGSVTTLAEKWNGKSLNAPNDVLVRSDGVIYFTDPGSSKDCEIPYNAVYCITSRGELKQIIKDMEFPNGIAFSPDERILYVANTRVSMHVSAYDVKSDGTVTNGRIIAKLTGDPATGFPDGLKIDSKGRIYCTGPNKGIWVFEPSGAYITTITFPEAPANMCFGGPDSRTMFVTARTSIYAMRMKTAGPKTPYS